MTWLAFLLAVSDNIAVTLRLGAAVAVVAAIGSAVYSNDKSSGHDADPARSKAAGVWARRFLIVAIVEAFVSAFVPMRSDITRGVDLARDLTCQPGGCP